MSNEPTREQDEFILAVMTAFEAAGIQVVTDADQPTVLIDLLSNEFEEAAAERAWARSKWDGRL